MLAKNSVRIEIIDVGSLPLLSFPRHVHRILFLIGHSPLLLPNPGGLAVGDSCPTPPDNRASKVAAWTRSTQGCGPVPAKNSTALNLRELAGLPRQARRGGYGPRRLTDKARLFLVFCSRWFDWRNALLVIKPETLIGWHRKAFQLFWRWKSRGGRPRIPRDLRALIAEMVRENPTWGQARVAAELAIKLGIFVSSRTVRFNPDPSSREACR